MVVPNWPPNMSALYFMMIECFSHPSSPFKSLVKQRDCEEVSPTAWRAFFCSLHQTQHQVRRVRDISLEWLSGRQWNGVIIFDSFSDAPNHFVEINFRFFCLFYSISSALCF
ncbi:hypothetical protein CEXT_292451 [Caerostris extrusa]|uniref:Uncharacterized protein n=1 Tax=Caerostris extrusa TaxID=172846 RepID=A0AAV4W9B2_CAEEX|nr:hypothetical protein CEXT_292451 [Caerostris extrusa]